MRHEGLFLLTMPIISKQCAIYENDFGAQSPGFES